MQVQAAYPLPLGSEKPECQPDDVIEVDDAEGARLIAEGLARVPDKKTGAKDMAAPKKGQSAHGIKVVAEGAQPASVTTPRGTSKGGEV